MKITDKTIKLVTALSIVLSLAFIITSLLIHLQDDQYLPNDTTKTESTSLSIDSEVGTTSSPDTTIPPSDSTAPQECTTVDTQPDITASLTVPTVTMQEETTVESTTETTPAPETTEEESTVPETTIEETTAEITTEETTEEATLPVETEPETTAHIHSYSDWTLYKPATCEKNGTNSRVCPCGETEYQSVPATGHTEKKVSGVDPTCALEGKTEGVVCVTCDKIIKKQTSLPKIKCKYENLICIYCGKNKEISIALTAPYAGLYRADTLECIYSVAADRKTPPASLTKMITACVAIKHVPLDTVLTVGTELSLVPKYSSLCYIYKGNKIKLSDLLTGMLLCSGNDAAYTIAANVGRTVSGDQNLSDRDAVDFFCTLMNDYAKEIGATNTNFTTPDGSDNANQYTTVTDIAIITAYAMNNQTIAKIASTHYKRVIFASGQIAKWTNTNELINPESIYYTEGVTGFKTGGTENAGKCLSATFEHDGKTYIAIVLGCKDNDARYENILKLIELITEN